MSQEKLNPEWEDAIKKVMHESIVNVDNDNKASSDESVSSSVSSASRSSRASSVRSSVSATAPVAGPATFGFGGFPSFGTAPTRSASSSTRSSVSSVKSRKSDRFRARGESRRVDEQQEKYELLSRIQHLEREKGYKCFRQLSPQDSIHDIRYEFFKAQREISKRTSVKLMQKYLVSFTSMIEMVSEWYNPFNLKLHGYSKSVLLTMKDYDPILEDLHYKYSNSVSVGPELKLVLALASSVFFYHTGHNLSYGRQNTGETFAEERETFAESRGDQRQGTMRGPTNPPPVSTTSSFNPMTMMMPAMGMMMPGGGNPLNMGDIMSGLNMVQTILKKDLA